MIPPSSRTSEAGDASGWPSCESCRKIFPTQSFLLEHVNSPEHPYKCAACRTHYGEKPVFRAHVEMSHMGYMCTFGSCPYWSSTKSDVEEHWEHFLTHEEVPEHASASVRAQESLNSGGASEKPSTSKGKAIVVEQQEDEVSDAPWSHRPTEKRIVLPAIVSLPTHGYSFDPRRMVCPFRLSISNIGETEDDRTHASCRALHKDIPSLINHLAQPVHGLHVTDSSVSTFGIYFPEQTGGFTKVFACNAGVCRTCWRTFKTAGELSTHLADSCTPRPLSNLDKHGVLYDAFVRNRSRPEKLPAVPISAIETTNASATIRHRSSSPHSPSYLPKLEEQFMRDFTCCDKTWPTLHDLLQHYEENHSQPNNPPKDPGNDVPRGPSHSRQGVFGSVHASNDTAGGTTSTAPAREKDETTVTQRKPESWVPAQTDDVPADFVLFANNGGASAYVENDEISSNRQISIPLNHVSLSPPAFDESDNDLIIPRAFNELPPEAFNIRDFELLPRSGGQFEPLLPETTDDVLDDNVDLDVTRSSLVHILNSDDTFRESERDRDGNRNASSLPQDSSVTATPPRSNRPQVSPDNGIFAQRLQAANSQHLNLVSPSDRASSTHRSAFRRGSPLAPGPRDGQKPTVSFDLAMSDILPTAQPVVYNQNTRDSQSPRGAPKAGPSSADGRQVRENMHDMNNNGNDSYDPFDPQHWMLDGLLDFNYSYAPEPAESAGVVGDFVKADLVSQHSSHPTKPESCESCRWRRSLNQEADPNCPHCTGASTATSFAPNNASSELHDPGSYMYPTTPMSMPASPFAPPAPASPLQSHKCDECNRTFDQYHKLNHHMRYHDRPHICQLPGCGKRFGTKTHLDRHVNDKHVSPRKYFCTESGCAYSKQGGRSWPRKDNWRRHMQNKHNITNPGEPVCDGIEQSAAELSNQPDEALPSLATGVAVGSPSLEPTSNNQAQEKAKRLRFSLIHELAGKDLSFNELVVKCQEGMDVDFQTHLETVARFDDGLQKWTLKQQCWKELDVHAYPYQREEERQSAINNAVKSYDRLRLGVSDPLWQKLLPVAERGKGICLSRIQAAIKINMQPPPEAPSHSVDPDMEDSGSGSGAKMRSNSGNKTTEELSANARSGKQIEDTIIQEFDRVVEADMVAKESRKVKLSELKQFATNSHPSTRVPQDLLPIIAKDHEAANGSGARHSSTISPVPNSQNKPEPHRWNSHPYRASEDDWEAEKEKDHLSKRFERDAESDEDQRDNSSKSERRRQRWRRRESPDITHEPTPQRSEGLSHTSEVDLSQTEEKEKARLAKRFERDDDGYDADSGRTSKNEFQRPRGRETAYVEPMGPAIPHPMAPPSSAIHPSVLVQPSRYDDKSPVHSDEDTGYFPHPLPRGWDREGPYDFTTANYLSSLDPAPTTTPQSSITLPPLQTMIDFATTTAEGTLVNQLPRPYPFETAFEEEDTEGEEKVLKSGQLLGGRKYRARTFVLPSHGTTEFMFAMECASVLRRDLLSLRAKVACIRLDTLMKDNLFARGLLTVVSRDTDVYVVRARDVFKLFGWLVIVDGQPGCDDYWTSRFPESSIYDGPPRPILLPKPETHDGTPMSEPWTQSEVPDHVSETDAWTDSGYNHTVTGQGESSILGDADQAYPVLAAHPFTAQTDSGYASLPHEKAKQPQSALEQLRESALSDAAVTNLDDDKDVGTVYSDDRSQASVSRTQRYISEFVDHLLGKIKHQMEEGSVGRLADCLPELLQAFALKVGQSSKTRGHYEVMYFVHKHRRTITQSLQNRIKQDEAHASAGVVDPCKDASGMSLDDKLSLWAKMASATEPEREVETEEMPEIESLEDELDINELFRYQTLITDSPAFDWLVGSLKRELNLANSAAIVMMDIRRRILQGLPAPRYVSRKQAVPSVQVVFRVEWDPISFIKEQGYDSDTGGILGKIITLTGSSADVQAATCEQYLCQTWPSTGKHMLRVIEGTVGKKNDDKPRERRTYVLPDNTRITASCTDRILTLEASGTAYSMAEIGEQLGWLITALRSSPDESGISLFYPTITRFQRGSTSTQPFSCDIGVSFEGSLGAPATTKLKNGECWRWIFRNPVIVWGYPVPRREELESGTGLEIPLDIMVALADATGVSEFDDRLFIKGYSAMLVPTKQVGDVIMWHLLLNADGSRIAYTDCRTAALDHINPTGIKQARHIVGWVSHARNNTGSPDANYDIKWSGLSKPRERHAWEKVVISGGDSVGVSASFVIGKKDKGILSGGLGGYASRLKFMSKQYVVLYDLDDRRAWLVDGLSALLHMVRASLEHDRKDVLNPYYLYTQGQMKECLPTMHGPEAAAAVLFNPQNCSLRLYTESEDTWDEETETQGNGAHGAALVREVVSKRRVTYYCLKDRVLEIFSLLEKMIDHLNNVQAETGVGFRLRGTPRNILEGFDFMDVATSNAPIRPHMIKLNICESGRGWTDLLRSIQAITLFGKGFGELITPSLPDPSTPGCGGCGYATSMPVDKDYLATCVSLVERILTTRGSTESVPWCLADDIYWHTPGALFDPCRCASSTKRAKPNGRVQVLLPSSNVSLKLWGRGLTSPQHLETLGAVMFSHNWKFPFRLGNENSHEETKMLEPPDSGLGTSIDSSSARSQLSGSFDDTSTQASNVGGGSSVRSVGAPTDPHSVVGTVALPLRTETGNSKKRKLGDIVDRVKRKVMKTSSDVELATITGGGTNDATT